MDFGKTNFDGSQDCSLPSLEALKPGFSEQKGLKRTPFKNITSLVNAGSVQAPAYFENGSSIDDISSLRGGYSSWKKSFASFHEQKSKENAFSNNFAPNTWENPIKSDRILSPCMAQSLRLESCPKDSPMSQQEQEGKACLHAEKENTCKPRANMGPQNIIFLCKFSNLGTQNLKSAILAPSKVGKTWRFNRTCFFLAPS